MPQESAPSQKPVLAIDVDEVLGQFVRQLCLFHNHNYGTSLTPEDFESYFFHEVWGGSRSSADAKMDEFFDSPFFLDGIPVVEGAERVLRKHAANFDLHVVTSRQDVLRAHTRRWVDANYPGLFAELHFGNHFSKDGVQKSKPELCSAIGAVLIIDDNMRYATQCAAAGIPAYLFGDYAWNRTVEPLPANVTRTVSWAEVEGKLEALLDGSGSGSGSDGCGGASDSTSNGGSNGGCRAHDVAVLAATAAASAAVAGATGTEQEDGGQPVTRAPETVVVGGAASTAATQNDDVGAAAPSDVGEDVVPCAA